jgi:ethanolamine phosphate transferase 2 subunit G
MVPSINTLLLTVANLLVPIALLTFASGFFPYKPFLPGLAEWMDTSPDPGPEPPFDKVVFMVVDALRRYRSTENAKRKTD